MMLVRQWSNECGDLVVLPGREATHTASTVGRVVMSEIQLQDETARAQARRLKALTDALAIEMAIAVAQEWPPEKLVALMRDRAAEIEPVFRAVQAAWQFENLHPTHKEVH